MYWCQIHAVIREQCRLRLQWGSDQWNCQWSTHNALRVIYTAGLKNLFLKCLGLLGFLYEDRTQKYNLKAHEKHPGEWFIWTPYLTKDKSPVSEGWKTPSQKLRPYGGIQMCIIIIIIIITSCENWKWSWNWWISQITFKTWIWRSFIKLHNKNSKKSKSAFEVSHRFFKPQIYISAIRV